MNIQEKLAAIEQHAAKSLIEIRELMVELAETDPENTPPAVSLFAAKARMRQLQSTKPGSGYVSPADESVEWPDDAADAADAAYHAALAALAAQQAKYDAADAAYHAGTA